MAVTTRARSSCADTPPRDGCPACETGEFSAPRDQRYSITARTLLCAHHRRRSVHVARGPRAAMPIRSAASVRATPGQVLEQARQASSALPCTVHAAGGRDATLALTRCRCCACVSAPAPAPSGKRTQQGARVSHAPHTTRWALWRRVTRVEAAKTRTPHCVPQTVDVDTGSRRTDTEARAAHASQYDPATLVARALRAPLPPSHAGAYRLTLLALTCCSRPT